MIIGKIWNSIKAQLNKLANWFSTADPVAQLQYEYDSAVEQLKDGKEGLAQYRALVERVTKQVNDEQKKIAKLEARVKASLKAGDRAKAAELALQLKQAREELAENQAQLDMHEKAYENNLTKIRHAGKNLEKVREKIKKYDAELKLSRAEAELADLAREFEFDVTTDFGRIEDVINDQISLNRAKARVAADLSGEGLAAIEQEEAAEAAMAEDALREFEIEAGLITPQTADVSADEKELGPATRATETQSE